MFGSVFIANPNPKVLKLRPFSEREPPAPPGGGRLLLRRRRRRGGRGVRVLQVQRVKLGGGQLLPRGGILRGNGGLGYAYLPDVNKDGAPEGRLGGDQHPPARRQGLP